MKDQSPSQSITLTFAKATETTGISRSELYRWLAAGKIAAIKSGRSTLIDAASLRSHLASLPKAEFRAQAVKVAA